MKSTVAVIRLVIAALSLYAVGGEFQNAIDVSGSVNPFDFFGYFTIQNNLMESAALVWAAVLLVAGLRGPRWLPYARGAVTCYIVIVGAVYWTLLVPPGGNGAEAVPWANAIVHGLVPAYALVDWVLVGDRPRLAWRGFWAIYPYGVVWVVVVLIRGATDGWVPYPFLNPAHGYVSVSIYCAAIFALATIAALGAWWVTRPASIVRVTGIVRSSSGDAV